MRYRDSTLRALILLLGPALLPSLAAAQAQDTNERTAIQAVLDAQLAAWNRGDLPGFMAGYWQSSGLVYLRNAEVIRGWQPLLDWYRQRFDPSKGTSMGTLELPEEEIVMLGRDAAVVWGKYVVKTKDGKQRGGLYTLAMRKLPEGWRTVYDRTSVEELGAGGPRHPG
ncbi:MAG TPA: DUF4440 domain-containing protein [Thermoanaerobaculia bacterium]|nr:DUF4440 domain-containing protein [Thermoanaerobaculia bacterium]